MSSHDCIDFAPGVNIIDVCLYQNLCPYVSCGVGARPHRGIWA